MAEIILKTQIKISLKCIAANAVKINNIPYRGLVPSGLEDFIELHGKGIERWEKYKKDLDSLWLQFNLDVVELLMRRFNNFWTIYKFYY